MSRHITRLLALGLLLSGLASAAEPRIVRVGTVDNPPIVFREATGEARGLAIDVLNYAAQNEGWRLEYVHGQFQAMLKQLERGEIDLLTGIAYTPERAQQFQFTDHTLLSNWGIVYARPGASIQSLLDLQHRRVAMSTGATHSNALSKLLKEFGVSIIPVAANNYSEVFALIASGQADAGVVSRVFSATHSTDYDVDSTGIVLNPIEVRYAAPKNADPAIVSALDRQLDALLQDSASVYFESLDRWLSLGRTKKLPEWVRWALIGTTATLLLALFFLFLLRRQVSAQAMILRDAEESYRVTFNHAPTGIARVGPDGNWLEVNQRLCDMVGYTRAELLKLSFQDITHPADLDKDLDLVRQVLAGKINNYNLEKRYLHKSGQSIWISLTVALVRKDDGSPKYFVSVIEDINQRKQSEETIHELAFFDPLTALPNRTLLLDRLKQTLVTSSRSGVYGALLIIDLDNFKTINDTRGHDIGDLLLKQVAQRLKLCVREGDTVARLGGDEFVVILAALSTMEVDAATDAENVSEKILAALGQSYVLDDGNHHSTASIGVTLFMGDLNSSDELLKQANLAMYRAKTAGRNGVSFFDPTMESTVKERAALEHDLRLALKGRQFLLHYQAQMEDGHLTGVEALARWQHPQRGLVSPAEFIPLAEETGLILPLGSLVLETACTQLTAWARRPEMSHLTIAVNVSAHQFRQSDFVDQVLKILKNSGANPQRLKLELTESLLVSNVEEVIEKMFALKASGVGFSLDDFGTGFSSLSYLKRLPLDQLKIDQSFVRDVLTDPNDASIVRTIIALSKNLGLGVIAEGVETAEQRDFLASSGCHAYQGYFFSRPLAIADFEEFARQV